MRIFIRHNMVEKYIYIHISVMSWSRVSGNRTNVGKNHSWEHFGWKIIQLKIGDGLEVLQFAATSNSERRSSELMIFMARLCNVSSTSVCAHVTSVRLECRSVLAIQVPDAEPYELFQKVLSGCCFGQDGINVFTSAHLRSLDTWMPSSLKLVTLSTVAPMHHQESAATACLLWSGRGTSP